MYTSSGLKEIIEKRYSHSIHIEWEITNIIKVSGPCQMFQTR